MGLRRRKQHRQTAFFPKTLRAAGLLPVTSVGSVGAARCGDAPTSPPWPQPKSLAAAPLIVFKQALIFLPRIFLPKIRWPRQPLLDKCRPSGRELPNSHLLSRAGFLTAAAFGKRAFVTVAAFVTNVLTRFVTV